MTPIVFTMPEAKYRSTKKRTQKVSSIRNSEYRYEYKAFRPRKTEAAEAVTAEAAPSAVKAEIKAEAKLAATKEAAPDFRKRIASFWPLAVGIFLAGFAPEWYAIASHAGEWALRITFPYVLLAGRREIGLNATVATMLPQLALYAQLPLDGLMLMFALGRGTTLKSAIAQVTSIHAVCAFVLWLMTYLRA